jgi:hypothetical protein
MLVEGPVEEWYRKLVYVLADEGELIESRLW